MLAPDGDGPARRAGPFPGGATKANLSSTSGIVLFCNPVGHAVDLALVDIALGVTVYSGRRGSPLIPFDEGRLIMEILATIGALAPRHRPSLARVRDGDVVRARVRGPHHPTPRLGLGLLNAPWMVLLVLGHLVGAAR